MKVSNLFILLLALILPLSLFSQSDHDRLITSLIGETPIEEDLQELCDQIGGRVTGTKANEQAVQWGHQKFKDAGVNAQLESFDMPSRWIADGTHLEISNKSGNSWTPLAVSKYKSKPGNYSGKLVFTEELTEEYFQALATSIQDNFIIVSTELCLDIDGLFAEYVHAKKVEDLANKYKAAGIIFMASRPAKLLYRFISSTGDEESIPQIVMAREDAKRCIRLLKTGENLGIQLEVKAETGDSFQSHNVIAEILGKKYPDEIIIIGAHLDSWALGTGANDNGCNFSMMIDIARQMKTLNIQADRTIRFALWNGEEQGYFGSEAYTKDHLKELDQHKLAISIDIGSGPILGYFTNGRKELIPLLDQLLTKVEGLGPFHNIDAAIVGTDNFDFMLQGIPNLVARHKPDLYGLNYHASSDTYDKVNLTALKINSAIVASTILQYANLPKEEIDQFKRQSREEVEEIISNQNLEFIMKMFAVWQPWVEGKRGLQLTKKALQN